MVPLIYTKAIGNVRYIMLGLTVDLSASHPGLISFDSRFPPRSLPVIVLISIIENAVVNNAREIPIFSTPSLAFPVLVYCSENIVV